MFAAGHDRARFLAFTTEIKSEIANHLVGVEELTTQALVAFMAGGHVLLESPPGLGKTTLAKTLAATLGLEFNRIQFTPDLMPFDITGSEKPVTSSVAQGLTLEFSPGPIFTTFLLADEINRAPPKTQAALLEAMAERQVSVAQRRFQLSKLFFVMATQNPVEMEGTYELPEAQLDRFMMKLVVPVPTQPAFAELIRVQASRHRTPAKIEAVAAKFFDVRPDDFASLSTRLESLIQGALGDMGPFEHHDKVATLCRITNLRRLAGDGPPADGSLFPGISADVQKDVWTRVAEGISPRAALDLVRAAQMLAALDNRTVADWDHVRRLIMPVLGHRLRFTFEGANLRNAATLKAWLEKLCDVVAAA